MLVELCMCMYLLVTRWLVIEEHKGFSPFQTREQGGAGSNYAWTNNDAQGMLLHVANGFVEGDKDLICSLLYTINSKNGRWGIRCTQ
jgi:hypothetical protein